MPNFLILESSVCRGIQSLAAAPVGPEASPEPAAGHSQSFLFLARRGRKAIELRELDERSTEETARIMGISVGAVKARVFQGRRKLRERLKHYFGSAWISGGTLHERSVTR